MSIRSYSVPRKVAAIAAAATLAITGVAGTVPVFQAVPVASAQAVTSMPTTGTLTIHKYDNAGGVGDAATGGALNPAPSGTALAGVKFDVYKVIDPTDNNPIDLTNQGDWQTASTIKLADLFSNVASRTVNTTKATYVTTLTTGSDGTIKSDSLPASQYLVVEQINQAVDGKTLVPTQPFLVTVPISKTDGTGWVSDVQVYPKNAVTDATTGEMAPTKTISDPVPSTTGVELTGSSKGEQIKYTLEATAPALPADNNYDGFVVADKLPSGISATAENVVVKVADNAIQTTDATYPYALEVRNVGGQSLVLVNFKPESDDPFASNLAGKKITVEITGTVNTVGAAADGVKANTGYFYPGYLDVSATDWDPTTDNKLIQSGTVKSIYGQVNITKTGANGGAALANAQFQLYRCTAEGATVGDALRFGGTETTPTTFTTNDQGKVSIEGIHLGNVDTAGAYTDVWKDKGTQFCLVETDAPDGYQAQPKPIPVVLTATADTAELVTTDSAVTNVKTNAGFQLPLTGGIGLWLILGAGVLALIASLVNRARKNS